ncbi:MAG: cupin domain-containing protein [Actinomycetota bacterium]
MSTDHTSTDPTTAADIIERLGLQPLPMEGGQWAVSWRNEHVSAIHFLLQPGDFSALHALAATELWHHHDGAPVQMVLLGPGGSVERPVLGSDLAAGHRPMVGVEPGVWMGASTLGEWSLLSTSVTPPYEDHHFTLGGRDQLLASHPDAAADIEALTRPIGEEP